MKTEWNYSELAEAYLRRPDYSPEALEQAFQRAGLKRGSKVCDVGAGVGHLTLELAKAGFDVSAVEPNDEMRVRGMKRTESMSNVRWTEGTAEDTKQPAGAFELVSFGSSFNVVDRDKALAETKRILKPGGWFCCLWNHRDLDDPVQKGIENVIHQHVKNYDYGTRRENQTPYLEGSGYFRSIEEISGTITHQSTRGEMVEAWRSHATLHRQAGDAFPAVVTAIEKFLDTQGEKIAVPYTTRLWIAQLK